jgi:hypothetical protein
MERVLMGGMLKIGGEYGALSINAVVFVQNELCNHKYRHPE